MSQDRIVPLRQMLEQIDGRLLEILISDRPLEQDCLEKIAVLESARGAVHRLLGAAEADARAGQPGDRA
jgi:hypothetical protein